MLNRCNVTLSDRTGLTREVFASRPGIVHVELQCDTRGLDVHSDIAPANRFAVLATPQPSFDPENDYLLAVVRAGGEVQKVERLYGTLPAEIDGDFDPSAFGARCVAHPSMGF